jgi:hypothetical protein
MTMSFDASCSVHVLKVFGRRDAQFEAFHPIGSRARLALALLLRDPHGPPARPGRLSDRVPLQNRRRPRHPHSSRFASDPCRAPGRALDLPKRRRASHSPLAVSPIGSAACAGTLACRSVSPRMACAKRCVAGAPRLDAPPIRSPRAVVMRHLRRSLGTRGQPTSGGWRSTRWRPFSEQKLPNLAERNCQTCHK